MPGDGSSVRDALNHQSLQVSAHRGQRAQDGDTGATGTTAARDR